MPLSLDRQTYAELFQQTTALVTNIGNRTELSTTLSQKLLDHAQRLDKPTRLALLPALAILDNASIPQVKPTAIRAPKQTNVLASLQPIPRMAQLFITGADYLRGPRLMLSTHIDHADIFYAARLDAKAGSSEVEAEANINAHLESLPISQQLIIAQMLLSTVQNEIK